MPQKSSDVYFRRLILNDLFFRAVKTKKQPASLKETAINSPSTLIFEDLALMRVPKSYITYR